MMGPFIAGAIIPSFEAIAHDLHIQMQTATYLSTLQIAVLAGAPIFWRPFIDRFGRRPLLLISALGNGISMAVIAGCSSQRDSNVALGFAVLFVFIFFASFPIGFLGVTFCYAAEISPLNIRVPITAMSTGCVCTYITTHCHISACVVNIADVRQGSSTS